MQSIIGTETELCLARAFAGESQASMRYRMIAERAAMDGLYEVWQLLRRRAHEEGAHAKVFYDLLTAEGGRRNIHIAAGYPYQGGSLLDSIAFSADNEKEEAESVYPAFAETAKKEGFIRVAQAFSMIAKIEQGHFLQLSALQEMLDSGTLYRKKAPITFTCNNYGHKATLTEPWKTCPVCGHPQGFVALQIQE